MPNVEHVAFAIHSLGGGGAERVAVFLANEMSRRGVRVDLVVLDPSGTYLPLVSPRVRIVKLGPSRVRYAVPALVRYLKTFEPQFFVSAVLHMNLATSIAWQWSQVPTRLILTETMNPAEHRTRTIYLRFRLAYAVAPFLYRRASQVVAVSEGAATAAAKVYGLRVDQLRAIPNPVLPDDWEKLAQEPVENDWFSGDGPPVVLAAGRLVPQKDFGNLIRAFTILRRHIDARLVILGEGPERAKLETLISAAGLRESVSLPGVVTNPIRFMARANAFVLSSLHEGMGLVLVEAMASGVPVVSTDCPSGPREILDGDRYGVLVPTGDSEALAAGIQRALEIGTDTEGARLRALQFSTRRVTDSYMDMFVDLMAKEKL